MFSFPLGQEPVPCHDTGGKRRRCRRGIFENPSQSPFAKGEVITPPSSDGEHICYNSITGFERRWSTMETLRFVYYKEKGKWVGWLEDYPDYRTQGTTLKELKENLKDIYEDLNNGIMIGA